MIGVFESMVRRCPQRTCFTFVDDTGEEAAYSYRETRLLSAALARCLRDRGVRPGDYVSIDLPNCPAYVYFVLAAAYGGFALVVLNNRLTEGEKTARLMEVERASNASISVRVNQGNVDRLMGRAMSLLTGEPAAGARGPVPTRASKRSRRRFSSFFSSLTRRTSRRSSRNRSAQDARAPHPSRLTKRESISILCSTRSSTTSPLPKAIPMLRSSFSFPRSTTTITSDVSESDASSAARRRSAMRRSS